MSQGKPGGRIRENLAGEGSQGLSPSLPQYANDPTNSQATQSFPSEFYPEAVLQSARASAEPQEQAIVYPSASDLVGPPISFASVNAPPIVPASFMTGTQSDGASTLAAKEEMALEGHGTFGEGSTFDAGTTQSHPGGTVGVSEGNRPLPQGGVPEPTTTTAVVLTIAVHANSPRKTDTSDSEDGVPVANMGFESLSEKPKPKSKEQPVAPALAATFARFQLAEAQAFALKKQKPADQPPSVQPSNNQPTKEASPVAHNLGRQEASAVYKPSVPSGDKTGGQGDNQTDKNDISGKEAELLGSTKDAASKQTEPEAGSSGIKVKETGSGQPTNRPPRPLEDPAFLNAKKYPELFESAGKEPRGYQPAGSANQLVNKIASAATNTQSVLPESTGNNSAPKQSDNSQAKGKPSSRTKSGDKQQGPGEPSSGAGKGISKDDPPAGGPPDPDDPELLAAADGGRVLYDKTGVTCQSRHGDPPNQIPKVGFSWLRPGLSTEEDVPNPTSSVMPNTSPYRPDDPSLGLYAHPLPEEGIPRPTTSTTRDEGDRSWTFTLTTHDQRFGQLTLIRPAREKWVTYDDLVDPIASIARREMYLDLGRLLHYHFYSDHDLETGSLYFTLMPHALSTVELRVELNSDGSIIALRDAPNLKEIVRKYGPIWFAIRTFPKASKDTLILRDGRDTNDTSKHIDIGHTDIFMDASTGSREFLLFATKFLNAMDIIYPPDDNKTRQGLKLKVWDHTDRNNEFLYVPSQWGVVLFEEFPTGDWVHLITQVLWKLDGRIIDVYPEDYKPLVYHSERLLSVPPTATRPVSAGPSSAPGKKQGNSRKSPEKTPPTPKSPETGNQSKKRKATSPADGNEPAPKENKTAKSVAASQKRSQYCPKCSANVQTLGKKRLSAHLKRCGIKASDLVMRTKQENDHIKAEDDDAHDHDSDNEEGQPVVASTEHDTGDPGPSGSKTDTTKDKEAPANDEESKAKAIDPKANKKRRRDPQDDNGQQPVRKSRRQQGKSPSPPQDS